jgi:hypothetical protein
VIGGDVRENIPYAVPIGDTPERILPDWKLTAHEDQRERIFTTRDQEETAQ